MPANSATISRELPTGTLSLIARSGRAIDDYCDVAARANPKRGFLIVSRILGRHLPADPRAMRQAMDELGAMVPGDLAGPAVILGMAETATALGQGVFAAYRRLNPDIESIYLQTSRQRVRGAEILASFEEGHSHATTHLIQAIDPHIARRLRAARSLVIVDDECSSGGTFIACAHAMRGLMPELQRIETCCITDWSNGGYIGRMPVVTAGHALLHGEMAWTARVGVAVQALPAGTNQPGLAPDSGMRSRTGITRPERATRPAFVSRPGERILVLGEGEHTYEALLVAEELQHAGVIVAVQSITRTPALTGHALQSVSGFSDSYGSHARCYLYNLLEHRPDHIVILTERPGDQLDEARAALADLGTNIPVTLLPCRYDDGR